MAVPTKTREAKYQSLLEENRKLRRRLSEMEAARAEMRITPGPLQEKTAILTSSICPMAISDTQGNLTYVNNAFLKAWGYAHEHEVLGKPVVSFWERPEEATAVIAALEENGEWSGEMSGLKKTGGIIQIELKANLFRDASGNPVAMMGSFLDITERKQAEETLRESEERLAVVLEGSQLGFWDWNIATGQVQRNARWAEMLGYTLQEIEFTTKQWSDLHHPDDRAAALQSIQDHLEGRTAMHSLEYRMRCKDGQYKWIQDRARIVRRDPQGKPMRMSGTHTDVTEQKQAEQERLEMERKMQHAQRLESLGVLAGGIAHDFNNLLQMIVANATLAKHENGENPTALGYLETIDGVVRRASGLTKQMLAYAGKGKFVVGPVDLSRVVREMGQLQQSSISKKANLCFDLMPDLPAIRADASQMIQVVMNLIINASEAIGDRPGEIRVKTGVVALDESQLGEFSSSHPLPEGKYVRLEVIDTGCGMDEETRTKIFDPFFSTKFTGRGLGLSAVQGIVRSHQGALQVQSQPGQGSAFTLLFPVSEQPAEVPTRSLAPRPQPQVQGTILVVDDEKMLRNVLRYQLEKMGLQVLEAPDGQEALEVYRQHGKEIALVILDYKMPKMDGVEALMGLRQLNPQVRAIFSSGYSAEEAIEEHGALGWAGFIQKPYAPDELKKMLLDLLQPLR